MTDATPKVSKTTKTQPLSNNKEATPKKKKSEPTPEIFKNTTFIFFEKEALFKTEKIKKTYGFMEDYDLKQAFLSLFTNMRMNAFRRIQNIRDAEIKKELSPMLSALQDSLDKISAISDKTKKTIDDTLKTRGHNKNIHEFESYVHSIVGASSSLMITLKDIGGKPTGSITQEIILYLIPIYEEGTEEKATTHPDTYSDKNKYIGDFYHFILACKEFFNNEFDIELQNDNTIGRYASTALRFTKKTKKESLKTLLC